MRITNNLMVNNAIRHMNENKEKLVNLQERVSSNKQFQSASDDPVGASTSMTIHSSLNSLNSYLDTANSTNDWMTQSDAAFSQLEDVATNAINLITNGINDTNGVTERVVALGTEMDGLLSQATDLSNSSKGGQYLFSGYKVTTKAFDVTGSTVTYNGDTGLMQRSLGPGQSVQMNIRGDQAIQPLLEALVAARDALKNNLPADMSTALDTLQTALDTLDSQRTSNGARLREVQSTSDYLVQTQTEAKSLLSKNEDANMAESIALLQNQQTTYQAVLEVSQRAVSAMSLFDYLK
jgi:flagellar hook-associated protein 3 FlgL